MCSPEVQLAYGFLFTQRILLQICTKSMKRAFLEFILIRLQQTQKYSEH